MADRDPLDVLLGRPDRPVAPSPAFEHRLRDRLMAELAAGAMSAGDPNPMHAHPLAQSSARPMGPASPAAPRPIRRVVRSRRRWLGAVEIAAALLLMVGAVGGYLTVNRMGSNDRVAAPSFATPGADVGPAAMAGGDAARSGMQPGPAPGGEVGVRWKAPVAPGHAGYTPIALGDRVYRVTSRQSSTSLDADDAIGGDLLWSTELDVFGDPAVTADLVYAVTQTFTPQGNDTIAATFLVSLSAADGSEAWRATLGDLGGALASSPIVAGNAVYMTDPDGTAYAFDAATGTELWTSAAAYSDDPRAEATGFDEGERVAGGIFAVGDDQLYVVNAGGQLFALDLDDGSANWNFTIRDRYLIAPSEIRPIATDGAVLVHIVGNNVNERMPTETISLLARVDAGSGSGFWFQEFPTYIADLVVVGDIALARTIELNDVAPSEEAPRIRDQPEGEPVEQPTDRLIAIGLNDAQQQWEKELGTGGVRLTAAGDQAYVADANGVLTAVDVATGTEAWTLPVVTEAGDPSMEVGRFSITSPPAVANGAIFVTDVDGTLYRIDDSGIVAGTPTAGA